MGFQNVYEMSSNTFKECEPGFMGPECTYSCRFPSYGTDCYLICGCIEELCDFQYGCISHSKESKYFNFLIQNVFLEFSICLINDHDIIRLMVHMKSLYFY